MQTCSKRERNNFDESSNNAVSLQTADFFFKVSALTPTIKIQWNGDTGENKHCEEITFSKMSFLWSES